jgi:hypothetical protein
LDTSAPVIPPGSSTGTASAREAADDVSTRVQSARDFAHAYLSLWSAPNRVTLASASSFYGPAVTFHGRTRSIDSVLSEKRRFAERWPDRVYRHRPETTQVDCDDAGDRCSVRSSFDFEAANARNGQRASGIGEHELIVSFASGKPVIVSENSRVIRRGHGNLTPLMNPGSNPVRIQAARDGSAGPSTRSRVELRGTTAIAPAPSVAVTRCRDYLVVQAQRFGSDQVSVSSAGPEVRIPDGSVGLPIDARVEYSREGRKQVRQAQVTCWVDPRGQIIALH